MELAPAFGPASCAAGYAPYMRVPLPGFLERHRPLANEFMAEFKEDDLPGLAAELAFRFFLSLFPLLLVLVTLGAYISEWAGVDDPSQEVIDAIGDSLPADASSVLERQIDDVISETNVALLSIGLAAALWSASGGAQSLMKATNRVYDLPETRNFAVKTGIAVGLVLFGGLGLLLAVSAMIATQALAGDIASGIGLGRGLAWIVQVARLPLIVFFVSFAIQMVYWIAPNRWGPPQLWSVGSVFFALGWAAFTVGFALYVSNFGSYNATYGAIAGVVIMLLWFQVSALLILVGAELNAVLEGRRMRAVIPSPMAVGPVLAADAAAAPRGRDSRRSGGGLGGAVCLGLLLAVLAWARRKPAGNR